VTPPAGNPSIPADQGKYRGSTSLTFNWTQGTASDWESGIAGYYLQVARDTGFTDLICNKNVGNVLSYTAAGCLQGSTYYARVRAKNAVGLYGSYSGISDGITVDTTIPEGTPSIPADEGPVANSYTLTFNWTQGTALDSESEIAGYWLQVSTDPDFTALFYNGYVGNVFSKPVSGTTKGVTYYARVRARNGAGLYGSYSGASDGIIVQAQDTTPPKGSPSVPLDAGTYTNSTSLTFNWTKGTAADVETGIAGYYLQVSTIPTFATLVFNGDVGNVLTKTIVNALKGNTYYARVRAKNGEGLYGVYSGVSDGIKVDTTAPVGVASTPLDSGVISVSTTIAFNWTQGTASDPESGISGYWLQVATDTSFANLVFNQLAGNVLTQSIAGCTDGLTYYARVRAVNGAGSYGSYSARSDGIKIQIAGPGNVPYIVYSDSAWSHGFAFDGPNGQTTTSISIDAANATSPAQGTTCTKFTYDKTKEGYIWVFNVYNGLWGPGISLTGNTKLTFKVRSAVAGVKIYFRMGLDYSADTTVKDLPGIPVTLSTAWTTYTIDLTGNNLSSINCFWNFTIGGLDNPSIPNPVIFYIDDVKYTN